MGGLHNVYINKNHPMKKSFNKNSFKLFKNNMTYINTKNIDIDKLGNVAYD